MIPLKTKLDQSLANFCLATHGFGIPTLVTCLNFVKYFVNNSIDDLSNDALLEDNFCLHTQQQPQQHSCNEHQANGFLIL